MTTNWPHVLTNGSPHEGGWPNGQAAPSKSMDLVFGIRDWVLRSAPKPMEQAALVCALATVGGIASRAYNINGTGTNGYYVLISPTGSGKGIIPKCFNRIITEVSKEVPGILSFKGMGFIASGQAIIKSLSDKDYPISTCMLDEIGHDLEEMANPRNVNGRTKEKVLLQLWGLSGRGNIFEPMMYADTDKNTKPLESPAFSFVGTTTPQKFNEYLGESSAENGMLPRLFTLENSDPIPPDNEFHEPNFNAFPDELKGGVRDLAAYSLQLSQQRQVLEVAMTPDARSYFKEQGEYVRHRLNATSEGPQRQLLNRAIEKSLKLAAIRAIGKNYLAPCITLDEATWSVELVVTETSRQIAKFNSGDAGDVVGNEVRQQNELRRVIVQFYDAEAGSLFTNYGCTYAMHSEGIFLYSYLSKRLIKLPTFAKDKIGGTNALKRALNFLEEIDEIRHVTTSHMEQRFQTSAKAFGAANLDKFMSDHGHLRSR